MFVVCFSLVLLVFSEIGFLCDIIGICSDYVVNFVEFSGLYFSNMFCFGRICCGFVLIFYMFSLYMCFFVFLVVLDWWMCLVCV